MLNADSEFDLAIIGGGPAGTSAAITAARAGARVALFEARSFPRHKVCGEFVSAESLGVLADLLCDASDALVGPAPRLERTRLFFRKRMVEAPIEPAGVSIARYDLDAALWRAAEMAGVAAYASTDIGQIRGDGPFEIAIGPQTVSSRAVLVAAGRWSQFTPDRAVPSGPKWIGLKCHFQESNPSVSTDLYFFDHGYCGVEPMSPDTVNACAMVRSDCATSLDEVFALHPRLAERAAVWKPLFSAVSTAPLVYRVPQPRQGNVLFVGDAAAFIDPFVGDGISIALRSGQVAGRCLEPLFAGSADLGACAARYEQEYSRQFAPLLSAASRVRALMSWPRTAQVLAFEALRLPGLIPFVIRKTRRAS